MRRFTNWAAQRFAGMEPVRKRSPKRRQVQRRRPLGAGLIEILEKRALLSATVASLGTATDHSSSHSDVVVSAAAAVPVNQTLIVEVAADPTLGAVTVADDQGNVYTQDANVTKAGLPGVETWIFSAPVTTALSAGDNITVHFAGFLGSLPTSKAVSALAVDGLAIAPKLDVTHTNDGYGKTPDSGLTSNTNYPEELLIGAIGVQGRNTDTFTPGSDYTLIGRTGTNAGGITTNVTINPEYRTVSAVGQYNANGTLDSNREWSAAIGTYVIDSGPVITPTPDQTNDEADAVSLQIEASGSLGGALQYSAAGLPDGLSIDSNTGLISGTISGVAADQSQPFNVDVSVSDGVTTSHDTFTWTVDNVAPLLTADDVSMTEGVASGLVTVGTFTDIGGPEPLGNYAAVIDWGDGSSSTGTISESAGVFTVQGNHTYAEESAADHTPGGLDHYILSVTVNDDNGITLVSSTANSNATVSDPAVIATGGYTVSATEGAASGLQTVATFTDPGGVEVVGDYSAMIDWGDGSSSAGSITETAGVFTVQGSHTYAEESAADHPGSNPYEITVTISHEDALPDATVTSVAEVSDPAVIATGGYTVSATEGAASGLQTVATFTDPGGVEDRRRLQAMIDWGDGSSSAGTITESAGVFTVQGSHTYAEESTADHAGSNPYQITVTISHEDSSPDATVTSVAEVADPAVIASGGFTVTATEQAASGLQTVATFTDPGGAEDVSDYTAMVDWGDGSSATIGTITESAGVFTVQGNHTYAEESIRTIPIRTFIRSPSQSVTRMPRRTRRRQASRT